LITGGSVVIATGSITMPIIVAGTIYVDKDAVGSGDGSSWEDAFIDLQSALDAAWPGNEIRVAEGIYLPDTTGLADPREATFQLKNYITIKGGFAGYGTTDPNDRDVELYETILLGDIGTTDDPNDNCYHVFYHQEGLALDPNAILDGFTIAAGNADGSGEHNTGGGMYNNYCSPTVTNCTFSGNSADYIGGGMYNEGGSPTMAGCTFSGNSADFGGGMFNAGIYNNSTPSPTITGCTFSGNSAGWGGGMYNSGIHYDNNSGPTVRNCTFSGNSANWCAGGMCNVVCCPTVTNCTFGGNSAKCGGGMFNYLIGSPKVTSCMFSGNFGKFGGGGMYNADHSHPTIANCTFTLNRATFVGIGRGIYNWDSRAKLTNCIIWGNTASSEGNEIALTESSTIDVDYCDVQSGQIGIYDDLSGNTINWGSGNIDAEPEFVDPGYWDPNNTPTDPNDDFWVDGDYHLLPASPCIDTGDNSVVDANSTDLDGNPRIVNGIVDMGAYEALLSIKADVHIVPRVINRNNRLKRIIAIMRLPEGISKSDVADELFVLYPDGSTEGIEASWERVIGWGNMTRVFAMFDKDELMAAVGDNGRVGLTVVGKIKSGQYIHGSDTIRIIQPRRRSWRRRRW